MAWHFSVPRRYVPRLTAEVQEENWSVRSINFTSVQSGKCFSTNIKDKLNRWVHLTRATSTRITLLRTLWTITDDSLSNLSLINLFHRSSSRFVLLKVHSVVFVTLLELGEFSQLNGVNKFFSCIKLHYSKSTFFPMNTYFFFFFAIKLFIYFQIFL